MPNRKSITNILGLAGQRNLIMRQCKNCCNIYLAVNNIPVLHKKVGQIARENSFLNHPVLFLRHGDAGTNCCQQSPVVNMSDL